MSKLRGLVASPRGLCALGVTAVAVAVRAPFIGMAVASPDTGDYLARAQMVVHGMDLPDPLRTPIFPLLLAAFEELGREPIVSVVVLQDLFATFLPAAVLLFGWRFFNGPIAVVAGFLAAAAPLLAITEQFALTDYLFGIGMFAGTALLAEAALRTRLGQPARRWLIAAGAAFGLATLVRGNGQYAIVAIPLALLLALRFREWRRALRSAGVSVAAMVVVIAPWVIHNMISYGTPLVTTLGGEALYVRVIDHDRQPPPDDSPEGKVARLTYNNTYAYAPPGEELNSGLVLAGVLAQEGKSNVEVSSIMMRLALEAISQNPSLYLENTWNILHEYQTMYDPYRDPTGDNIARVRNDLQVLGPGITVHGRSDTLPGDSMLTRAFWGLAQFVGRIVYLLSLGGLLALALPFFGSLRSRIGAIVLLVVVLLGFVVGAASEHFDLRYDLPYATMVWLLMAAISAALIQIVILGARSIAEGCSPSEVFGRLAAQMKLGKGV